MHPSIRSKGRPSTLQGLKTYTSSTRFLYRGKVQNLHGKNFWNNTINNCCFKVENILKGSLDLIQSPSPSLKIQIMGGKVCLRCKSKTMFCLITSCKLSANNLNFHWKLRWWDWIQAIFFNIFYFTVKNFSKGCLISERFSHWLQSTKKYAKITLRERSLMTSHIRVGRGPR